VKTQTTLGEIDDSELEKRETRGVNGTLVVDYYKDNILVHRSAVVELQGLEATGIAKI
jgi:hypothetical protein